MFRWLLVVGACTCTMCPVSADETPRVRGFEIQHSNGTAYFMVSVQPPPGIVIASSPNLHPRLVPQTDDVQNVILVKNHISELTFAGRWIGDKTEVPCLLLCPVESKAKGSHTWMVFALTLRQSDKPTLNLEAEIRDHVLLQPHDMERRWAFAMMTQLEQLHKESPDFGFYPTARQLLGRQFKVPLPRESESVASLDRDHRWIYEMFTGGTAIAESLQRGRLLQSRTKEDRLIPVKEVPGITIAEHPWIQMMGQKKPAPEPMAEFIPADNYYARFRNLEKLTQFGALIEQWGTNLMHAAEFTNREAYLRSRYERQLCVSTERMARTIPPDMIQELALTGSDPYFRDGTDLSVVFRVKEVKPFLAFMEPFIREQKDAFRSEWKESREMYQKFEIESFTTPLREVSLYRTTHQSVVIISNSPVGIRRILDCVTHPDRALSRSLDFQYMRTCFRADDATEDGFAFLPDAWIRRLVGPSDKIKQSRRAEALTSLHLVTNGAMYTGWMTGKLPTDHDDLIKRSGLKADELIVADSQPVRWDANKRCAISDTFGTLQFSTPLIELPIDRVTLGERQEYLGFQQSYLNLWRRFFDPIGFRFAQSGKQSKFEVYILPLINSNDYSLLRMIIGDGLTLNGTIPPEKDTVLHMGLHISDQVRSFLMAIMSNGGGNVGNWLGDNLSLSIDEGTAWKDLMKLIIHQMENSGGTPDEQYYSVWKKVPFVVGVKLNKVEGLPNLLSWLRGNVGKEVIEKLPPYRGQVITKASGRSNDLQTDLTWYHVTLGDVWYVGLTESAIKSRVDRFVDQKMVVVNDKLPVNATMQVRPGAGPEAREAIGMYLEWQGHRQALMANPMWYALHRSGAIPKNASEADERRIARQWLGYEPVSPDHSGYRYDRRLDEVVNVRHQTFRAPNLRPTLALTAPMRQMMEQYQSLRIDFRFREDGIHTTMTLERK